MADPRDPVPPKPPADTTAPGASVQGTGAADLAGTVIGAARNAGQVVSEAVVRVVDGTADVAQRTAQAATQAATQGASLAADATLKGVSLAADATVKGATLAADATVKSATFTARVLAWLLARMPMRQIIYLGIAAGVLLLTLIGLLIWVLGWLWHPQVDLNRWRAQAEQTLSQAAGRTVTIADARLTVDRAPVLRVKGLSIANAPGFSARPLARVDEAVLQVDATAFSNGQLLVRQATLKGVHLSLENRASGNNWTLVPPGRVNRDKRESFLAALPLATLARLVVDEARIEDLRVDSSGIQGQTDSWVLPQSVLTAHAGQPVQFNAQGERCAKGQSCSMQITTGALADLARIDSGELKDWPVNLTVGWGERILAFSGALQLRSMQGLMSAAAPRIEQDLASLGVKLRGPLPAAIGADFTLTATGLDIRSLTTTVGDALITGDWKADWTLDVDARPSVKGTVEITGLDDMLEAALPPKAQRPRRADPQAASPPVPGGSGLRRFYESLGEFEIDPTALRRADAQLLVRMPRFDALGVQASASAATITLVAGQFTAPVRTTLWGAAFDAELQVDASPAVPTFQLDLRSRDADLGALARGALGLPGVQGRTGALRAALASRGETLAQWLRALDLRLTLDGAQALLGSAAPAGMPASLPANAGTPASTRALTVDLQHLELRLPSLKPLSGALDARVLGRPLRASLTGSTLEQIMRAEQSRLALAVRSEDLTLDLDALLAAPGSRASDELGIHLRAPRAAALASWFGFDPGARQAQAPLALDARFVRARGAGEGMVAGLSLAQPLVLSLGQTELRMQARQQQIEGRAVTELDIAIPRLVAADLDALMPARAATGPAGSAANAGARSHGLSLDLPVLPQRISFADANLALHVGEIVGPALSMRDIEFRGAMRDGHLEAAPLSMKLDGRPVNGAISLDLRGDEPQAGVWLAIGQPDIGQLARRLGVATQLDLRFSHMSLYLVARARRLGDMLARSDMVASVEGGELRLTDPASGQVRRVQLAQGTLDASRGAPVTLALRGAVDGQTATLTIASGSVLELLDMATPIPVRLRADIDGQWAEIGARFERRIQAPQGELSLRAGGQRLDGLNRASGLNLPPWGPWTMDARLRLSPGRYELDRIRLGVGSSVLAGSLSLAVPAKGQGSEAGGVSRPTLRARLQATRIELDDFPTAGWSAVRGTQDPAGAAAKPPTPEGDDGRAMEQIRAQVHRGDGLLASGTLERYDVDADLALDEVLSGGARLGGGTVSLRLAGGALRIDPLRVELPGGVAQLKLGFARTPAGERSGQVDIDISNLDYGVIAGLLTRRLPGFAPPQGRLSLKLQAQATVPEIDQIVERGTGRVELMLWPRDLSSQKLDLWVNNLVTSLVASVDKSEEPKVNCAILRAGLERGVLTPQTLLVDTSAMRVRGKGTVNLATGQYALRFEPQAKQAQFFSLGTPANVTGPLNKPKVELSGGDIAQTVLRFVTSVFWVPVQKLAGQRLPADGGDVCGGVAAGK